MNGLVLNNLKSASQTFEEEGILFFPKLLAGAELDRLRVACEYVLERYRAHVDAHTPSLRDFPSMRLLEEPIWHPETQEHRLLLMEIIADPRFLGAAEQAFDGRSLYRSSTLFFNPRFESNEGDWHRDLQFLVKDEEELKARIGRQRAGGIQLQIALIDNDDIEYVPFSAGRYDSPEEYYIRAADNRAHNREAGMPGAMRIPLRAGDAIIVNANGLHRGRYLVDNPRADGYHRGARRRRG